MGTARSSRRGSAIKRGCEGEMKEVGVWASHRAPGPMGTEVTSTRGENERPRVGLPPLARPRPCPRRPSAWPPLPKDRCSLPFPRTYRPFSTRDRPGKVLRQRLPSSDQRPPAAHRRTQAGLSFRSLLDPTRPDRDEVGKRLALPSRQATSPLLQATEASNSRIYHSAFGTDNRICS